MPVRLGLALLFLSALASAQPLVPLEGSPGEAVLVAYRGDPTVEVPEPLLLLLPPQTETGVTTLVVRIPPGTPAGEYPLRLGGATYLFRVRAQPKVLLLQWETKQGGSGEEIVLKAMLLNAGNVAFPLPPKATGVGLEVLEAGPKETLPPGERGWVAYRLRLLGSRGYLQLDLPGAFPERARLEIQVPPSPPPPFHDWFRLPSRLLLDASGPALQGGGLLRDALGRSLGRLDYRFSPQGASLGYAHPLFSVQATAGGGLLALSLGYTPRPWLLGLSLDTHGRAKAQLAYAEPQLRLQGEVAWTGALSWSLLGEGTERLGEGALGWSLRLDPEGVGGSLSWSHSPSGFRFGVGYARDGLFLGFRTPLIPGMNGGVDVRLSGDGLYPSLLLGTTLAPLGTVEARVGLNENGPAFFLAHIRTSRDEGVSGQLALFPGEGRGSYSLQTRARLGDMPFGVQGGLSWSPEKWEVRLGIETGFSPLSLRADLGLSSEGKRIFRLGGSLAFDLPLYPYAWPLLQLVVKDGRGESLPGATLEIQGPQRYLLVADTQGRIEVRLPPGQYLLLPSQGLAFLERSPKGSLSLVLKEDLALDLTLVPVARLRLLRGACEVPAGFRIRLVPEGGGEAWELAPGDEVLLPLGIYRLELARSYPGWREVEPKSVELRETVSLAVCPQPTPFILEEVPLLPGE